MKFFTSKKAHLLFQVACFTFFLIFEIQPFTASQSRLPFRGREIFLSGINIAWANYAADLGPGAVDINSFSTIFKTVHENGGNSLRLWLHTNGTNTPEYDTNGFVTGPGIYAIQDLKQILDTAGHYDVGLQLCLWSFDMLQDSEFTDTVRLNDNLKMLTDTAYTNSYIKNSLIPMVEALKGNPNILSWEVFNEPEGMSEEYGWSGVRRVLMADIQRFINLVAGAIHRTDPEALVTNGAGSLKYCSNVNAVSKISAINNIENMSGSKRQEITREFNSIHRLNYTTDQYISYLEKIAAVPNKNYYSNDELITAGGDSLGTLDYYTSHYYTVDATALQLSPFNHPYSYWQLKKPLAITEFYMLDNTNGISYSKLYYTLYNSGYAGAMSWSWSDNYQGVQRSRTLSSMKYMFDNYRNDVLVNPQTGTIYKFYADAPTLQKGDSTIIHWDVESGSTVTLNGQKVNALDSLIIKPLTTSTYVLNASGQVNDSKKITVTVLSTGKIISFKAVPCEIGIGENATLMWQAVKGSKVKLNGNIVNVTDTLIVFPDTVHNKYQLVASGDIKDSVMITIHVLPPDSANRALKNFVAVSSNDTALYKYSKPQNINDGNNSTRWQAASGNNQWVMIDLLRSIKIKKIVIHWGGAQDYAAKYNIQVSVDSVSWTVLQSVFNGTGGINNIEILDNLDGIGRYVTFQLQTMAVNPVSIAEIEIYGIPATIVSVPEPSDKPAAYSLSQNYPNPFNPSTEIRYSIRAASKVELTIYNILGQKIITLVNAQKAAGNYSVKFDASRFSSGVYFYSLKAGDFYETKKMILLK